MNIKSFSAGDNSGFKDYPSSGKPVRVYTGCPKKNQKLLKSPMLTFECPSTC